MFASSSTIYYLIDWLPSTYHSICSFFFSRFVPSVNASIYHGNKKEMDEIRRKHMPRTIGPDFPIVITSYEVALNDAKRNLRPCLFIFFF